MPRQVLPSNQEDREVYLREHDAANVIEAVKSTQTEQADTLITMLDAFWNEPELLNVALNYARDQGVTVTMATTKPGQLTQGVPPPRHPHESRRGTSDIGS
jgi:hypothetical protein